MKWISLAHLSAGVSAKELNDQRSRTPPADQRKHKTWVDGTRCRRQLAVARLSITLKPIEAFCGFPLQVSGFGFPVLSFSHQKWILQIKWIAVLVHLHALIRKRCWKLLPLPAAFVVWMEMMILYTILSSFHLRCLLFDRNANFPLVRQATFNFLTTYFTPGFVRLVFVLISIDLSPPLDFRILISPAETSYLWLKNFALFTSPPMTTTCSFALSSSKLRYSFQLPN